MVSNRSDVDASTPIERPTSTSVHWEDMRCRSCTRLLCKNTRNALRPGQMIEIKCSACNAVNFLMGRPDVA
jgi:phage FluMu protein Com